MLLGQIPSEPLVLWRKDARVSACRWQVFVVTQSAKCASQFRRCRSCTHVDDVLQHMDAVLPGRGPVRRHVPGICIPPRAGGCQLVHPSTTHFLYLPFSALLTIGGDEVDISSFRRSAATRISRSIFPIMTLLDS